MSVHPVPNALLRRLVPGTIKIRNSFRVVDEDLLRKRTRELMEHIESPHPEDADVISTYDCASVIATHLDVFAFELGRIDGLLATNDTASSHDAYEAAYGRPFPFEDLDGTGWLAFGLERAL